MDKKKMMYVGIGAVALIAGYFLFFRKKSENGGTSGIGGTTGGTASKLSGGTIKVGPARGAGKGNWFGVYEDANRLKIQDWSVGKSVRVNGADCTISKFWTNSNGLKAAFRCEEIPLGSYPTTGGETSVTVEY